MWTKPKTDWKPSDPINLTDYNRIKNNLSHLQEMVARVLPDVPLQGMGPDKLDYRENIYAPEVNRLEVNLEALRMGTYSWLKNNQRTWYANQSYLDCAELNRLESLSLQLHERLSNQADGRRRLALTLGPGRKFDT